MAGKQKKNLIYYSQYLDIKNMVIKTNYDL